MSCVHFWASWRLLSFTQWPSQSWYLFHNIYLVVAGQSSLYILTRLSRYYRLTQTLSSCSVKGRLLTLAAMHVSVHLPTSPKFYWLWVLVFDSSVVWLMMVQSFSVFRVESYFGHCACSSWSWFFALKHTSSGLHIVLGFLLAKVYVAHISHSFVFVIYPYHSIVILELRWHIVESYVFNLLWESLLLSAWTPFICSVNNGVLGLKYVILFFYFIYWFLL